MYAAATSETLPNGKRPGKTTRLPVTGARIAALAIGVPASLALIGLGGVTAVAAIGQGQFPISDTVPVSGGHLTAHLGGGDVELRQGAAGQATMTGTAQYTLVRSTFTAQRTADGVDFGYRCRFAIGNCGLNAAITVPAGTATSVYTDGGNATVTGTTGAVTLSSGGGNLTASHAAGNLTLNTDGGNVNGIAITAPRVTADSGGGDILIEFTSAPDNVTVHTDGGNVTILLPRSSRAFKLSASTDGGSVDDSTVSTSPHSQYTITATSGGGNITIREAP
jgi:hypothetical protein